MSTLQTSSGATERALVHEALLYRNQAQLERTLLDFVTAGAEAGEPVLAVLPSSNLELLQTAVGEGSGEIKFEDMTVLGHNPNCLLALYQDWIDASDCPVRVIGEAIWPGRSYAEIVECLRHEALLNHALESAQASILCPYDAEQLDADALAGAELTHPRLMTGDGQHSVSERYGDPVELHAGTLWPQAVPTEPVHDHSFAGDLQGLRRSVAADPIVAELSSPRRSDLVFSVSEVAANAIKHGDGDCAARIWHDGVSVVVEVSTSSTIADAAAGRRRPALDAVSGRGLWLVNQVCDLVELRSGPDGTTLRMHVRD